MKVFGRKWLCVFLSVFILILTACSGDKEALIGRWTGEIDITELLNIRFLSQLPEDMADHIRLSEFTVTMNLHFREDDTYAITIDEQKLYSTMRTVKSNLRQGLESYLRAAASSGEDDANAFPDSGEYADTVLESVLSDQAIQNMVEALCAQTNTEGKFRTKDGRLYMSDSTQEDAGENMYDDYTLVDDVLTLVIPAEAKDRSPEGLYPMSFRRVA